MTLELDDERRKRMLGDIRTFFEDKLDDDIGDLKAMLVLDFFMGHLACEIYNSAVEDAQSWMQDKLLDIDGELHQEGGG